MRYVSFMCNFWTILLSGQVIYSLLKRVSIVKHEKLEPMHTQLKTRLYQTSAIFVSLILV